MSQVFCDWKCVNGPKKGTICNRRIQVKGRTRCWQHCIERKEKVQQYYDLNRDQFLEYKKQYFQDHKEHLTSKSKEWKNKNKDILREWYKKYYHENKEHKKEIQKKSKCKNWQTTLVNSCRVHDRSDNNYFNLDTKWIDKLFDNQEGCCFHCNQYLLLENGNRDPEQASIDRIDNSKGHIRGNVVLSCWHCNYTRRKTDINIFTPTPKYTILQDDEESENEESD
jgi:hypothetical protein